MKFVFSSNHCEQWQQWSQTAGEAAVPSVFLSKFTACYFKLWQQGLLHPAKQHTETKILHLQGKSYYHRTLLSASNHKTNAEISWLPQFPLLHTLNQLASSHIQRNKRSERKKRPHRQEKTLINLWASSIL